MQSSPWSRNGGALAVNPQIVNLKAPIDLGVAPGHGVQVIRMASISLVYMMDAIMVDDQECCFVWDKQVSVGNSPGGLVCCLMLVSIPLVGCTLMYADQEYCEFVQSNQLYL